MSEYKRLQVNGCEVYVQTLPQREVENDSPVEPREPLIEHFKITVTLYHKFFPFQSQDPCCHAAHRTQCPFYQARTCWCD